MQTSYSVVDRMLKLLCLSCFHSESR